MAISAKVVSVPSHLPAIAGGIPVRSLENRILFSRPVIGNDEIQAVADCLRSGWIGAGERVAAFEREFATYKGAPRAVAVSSCTAALHLTLLALGIGPGDEVIVPSMTFCATANVVVHTGAKPVLADCNPSTCNVEAGDIERRITPLTRAIMVVHLYGRPCDMRPILALARLHRLRVIEDCAHAVETADGALKAGMIGDVGCFSFYATKNLTTADGGMVISRNLRLLGRIKRLSMHGITSDAWSRAVLKTFGYLTVDAGFKYNMTDLSAALGRVQLRALEERWRVRQSLWKAYDTALYGLPLDVPPGVGPGIRHGLHVYTPLLRLEELTVGRDAIAAAMQAENIAVGIHFPPVHVQPFYRKRFGYRPSDLPNARRVGERTISLPLSAALNCTDVADVCEAVRRILRYYSR